MWKLKNLSVIWKVFFLLIFISVLPVYAQETGSVRGKIIDAEAAEPVFGVTVVVRALGKGTRTDFDGKYSLDLPPGTYQIEYIMMGFDTQKKSVTVSAGSTKVQDITFGFKALDVVEVEGRALNNTDSSLLQVQKKSGSVSDGVSAESIKKSPDSSAGEVLKRVTGVTLVGGKYVFVRGLGERYSNTMLNDMPIPSTEPDKRVIPMDLFPSGSIKNLRIIKSFIPEDPAEFSGGIVKVETKEYPDQFEASVGLGIGRNYNTTGNQFFTFKGGGSRNSLGLVGSNQELPSIISSFPDFQPFVPADSFGGIPAPLVNLSTASFDQQWTPDRISAPYDKSLSASIGDTYKSESWGRVGVLVGTSYNRKFRYREEKLKRYVGQPLIVPAITTDFTYLDRLQEQDVKVYNEEVLWGTNSNIAYEPVNGQQIFLKSLFTTQSDKFVRDSDGYNAIDNQLFRNQTLGFTSRRLFTNTLGGNHAINIGEGRPHILEWKTSYSTANRDEPDLRNQLWIRSEFNPERAFNKSGNRPDGSRFFSESEDVMKSISLKYEIPFKQWSGLSSKFKTGYFASARGKDFRFREFQQRRQVGSDQDVIYPLGGELLYNPIAFLDETRLFQERLGEPNAYDSQQRLHAYFGQVDMPLIPKVRFVGGVRYEDSYQKVQTYQIRDQYNLSKLSYGCQYSSALERDFLVENNICTSNNNGIGELKTEDYLPSLNFVWEFAKDQNLRWAYTETLTRPDLRELSPFGFAAYFGADRIFGNANLQRSYIHNYDFKYEWFVKGADYVGAGVFYKQISSPIEIVGQPVAGSPGFLYTYTNAQSAFIQGIELDGRMDFLKYFRFESNFFFIKSEVEVMSDTQFTALKLGLIPTSSQIAAYDPTNRKRSLQGQSDFVYNGKILFFFSTKKTTSIGLYYNYFGDRISVVGAANAPDAYERGVGLTDIVFQHQHGSKLSIKLAARNIMDTRFYTYQENPLFGTEDLFLSYREGVSFSASANYKF
ncbi:MAG: TonB-dependent receptor [Spirochaetota bacterium]